MYALSRIVETIWTTLDGAILRFAIRHSEIELRHFLRLGLHEAHAGQSYLGREPVNCFRIAEPDTERHTRGQAVARDDPAEQDRAAERCRTKRGQREITRAATVHQPTIAPMIKPTTKRPPARRVTRNDNAANHSGHTGFGIGDTSGFGWLYASNVRRFSRRDWDVDRQNDQYRNGCQRERYDETGPDAFEGLVQLLLVYLHRELD